MWRKLQVKQFYEKLEFWDWKPMYRIYEHWANASDKQIRKGLEGILLDSLNDLNLRKANPNQKPVRTEKYSITIVVPEGANIERVSKEFTNLYYNQPYNLLMKVRDALYFGTAGICAGYIMSADAGILKQSTIPFLGIVGTFIAGMVFDKFYTSKRQEEWKKFMDREIIVEYMDSKVFREADS